MRNEFAFRCASCGAQLESSGGQLHCATCGTNTPLYDGVPSFTDNNEYFFGEISRAAMRELTSAIDRVGWDAAFEAMCDDQEADLRDYIRQYIADASRANWKYALQLPEDGTVLDFGCGWGEISLSLARSVRRVVSMDLTLERLLLLRARSRDLGLNHVAFAHGGDVLPLPFEDQTFDAVVLNGVLEWVPVTGNGHPRQCQLAILRELRRTLKPTGQLYIGIENRVGLKYFLGRIDEHSQMKYTSLMPRWLANQWSRARRGEHYRTYTYSRRGYAKLLKEAGFHQTDFYCPYFDYREFDRIVPVSTKDVRQLFTPTSLWKRLVLRMPGCPQLLTWAVPTFSIVASNAPPGASRLRRIVNEVSNRTGVELDTPAGYHSKPIGEVFAYCAKAGGTKPTFLLRIAETQTAMEMRLASAKHLESLWDRCRGMGPCMDVVPRSEGHGLLNGVAFTVEEFKTGVSWRKINDFRKTPGDAVLVVARWLAEFQQATKANEIWDPRSVRAHAVSLADRVQGILPKCREMLAELDGNSVCVTEADSLANLEGIPVVVCHGDLHLNNALFSPTDKRLTGVVDWDLGDMRGLPLTDLIILLMVHGMEVEGKTYCKAVQSIIEPGTLNESARRALIEYETAFAFDETYRRYAIKVAVLQNIVTMSTRRPEAFKRLEKDVMALLPWLIRSARVPEVAVSRTNT